MDGLNNKTALVTGGSRGLGRGIVEALATEGVTVWVLARDAARLDKLRQEFKGVQTICADISDPHVAGQALKETQPDILILNAGATPVNVPVHEQSWEQFSNAWNTDVKSTFFFGKEALTIPMKPGSTVMIMSSGAAVAGSFLSGGYAGAKRMQWFLAQYFQEESNRLNRGIRFLAMLPRQIIGTTDLGNTASLAYAARLGITQEEYLKRFGVPLNAEKVGHSVIALLTDSAYREGTVFGITGEGIATV
jgi:NAD(P)-dependent dehydrogenase (short-subunit alcohol dehydrogenase family)